MPGNAFCMWSYACTTGSDFGNVSGPGSAKRSCSAGIASDDQQPSGQDAPEQRPAQHAVDDRAPDAALAVVAAETADERDADAVDAVAEPREQRGEHRQRAEHRDRDHDDRRNAERGEDLVAGQEHAGHRDDHGQSGDEHRATGSCGRGLERVPLAPAGGAFLPLAPQVEHRVVDADREPDQQHESRRLHRDREDVARDGDQSESREHRGQREQQRDTRGDERTEREGEDAERDREREEAGLPEVVLERSHERVDLAGVAELADEELRVGRLELVDPVEDRVDLVAGVVGSPADLELDKG